jgi:hypothetical protein
VDGVDGVDGGDGVDGDSKYSAGLGPGALLLAGRMPARAGRMPAIPGPICEEAWWHPAWLVRLKAKG